MPNELDILTTRPRLKQNTVFIRVADGVFLRSADNAFVLRGKGAYSWLSALAPHLDGTTAMNDLCDGLSADQRSTMIRLIGTLFDRGIVIDRRPENVALPEAVTRRFAAQINLVEHYADAPTGRFARFRDASVRLHGSGETLIAAGRGLLRNGLARLTVVPVSDPSPIVAALRDEAESLTAEGVPATVVEATADTPCETVVYCADDGDAREIAALNERCHREGASFLPLLLNDGNALLGPVVRPASGPCWMCAALRLAANGDPASAARLWQGIAIGFRPSSRPAIAPTVGRMLGNAVAFELFRYLTGMAQLDTDAHLVVQDIDTLDSTRQAVAAHPRCPVCSRPETPAATEPTRLLGRSLSDAEAAATDASDEDAYERLKRFVAPDAGLISAFTDDDTPQTPLKVGLVLMGAAAAGGPPAPFAGFHVDTVLRARMAATAVALRTYAEVQADPRSMVTTPPDDLPGEAPAVPPSLLLTWSGAPATGPHATGPWIRATSLAGGAEYHLPGAAVFPESRVNADGVFERTPAGSGAGLTPARAAMAGLITVLAYRDLCELVRGRTALAPLDEPDRLDDARVRFLLASIGHLGHRARIWLVTGPAPVRVAVVERDDGDVTVGSGTSVRAAVADALRACLGPLQLAATGHPASWITAAPLMPDLRIPTVTRAADLDADMLTAAPATPADLLDHVRTAGADALVVDTTPSDVRMTETFTTCRVLLRLPEQAPRTTTG